MSLFSDNIRHLRNHKGLTQKKLAEKLIITRARLAKYEEGKSEPPIEILKRIATYFHISIDILVYVDMRELSYEKLMKLENNRILLPIMIDQEGQDQIEVVPIEGAAGYLGGYADPEYIESLNRINLPFLPTGKHRAFRIKGDSMLPIRSGSFIIGRYLEKMQDIKDGRSYIVITRDEGIVYKRVYNQIKKQKRLELQSDNKAFKTYHINIEDVIELWEFSCCIQMEDDPEQKAGMDEVHHLLKHILSKLD